ncbi:MAG TPA: hypothetical protein VGT03_05210 [Candidatus Acidoferrales bacterium]|nr:hypothetical protein [Candidatus Acidoferrales bacterium]
MKKLTSLPNNLDYEERAFGSGMPSHSKALTSASTQFLIGNETSSHFRVSHRKQRPGPFSNREEFSLFSYHASQIPISAAGEVPPSTVFLVAEIHHLCWKTTDFPVALRDLILCNACNRQKIKHLEDTSEFTADGTAPALCTHVILNLDRTIPSGGGS